MFDAGVEPAQSFDRQNLNLSRVPFRQSNNPPLVEPIHGTCSVRQQGRHTHAAGPVEIPYSSYKELYISLIHRTNLVPKAKNIFQQS